MSDNPNYKTHWKKGDWNAICDVCGQQFKASELQKRWDGLMTCKEDWEVRHPLDFIRVKPDRQSVPWTRHGDIQTITVYTTNQSLSVTTTGTLVFYFDTTSGGLTVTLPAANSAGFNTISVSYKICNHAGNNAITITSTSPFLGSTSVASGAQGIFRNVVSNNIWIRDA